MNRSNYDTVTGEGLPPDDTTHKVSPYVVIWWALVIFVLVNVISCGA